MPGPIAGVKNAPVERCPSSRLGRRDVAAAGLLLAFALLFYYPLVFLGRGLVDFDAFVYFMPQRAYLAQALWDLRLPQWNPFLFMGAPFLANPQTAVFYPPSWLFMLGPAQAVYTVQLVLHAFLAALFTFLLARVAFGCTPGAAAVGGLAFGFGGFMVGQVGHLNQLSAAPWLPAVLLCYDQAVRRGSPAFAALGGLALAAQLFAGHPQETYMTALALVLLGVVRAPWRNPRRLAWAALAGVLVAVLGALAAAVQLLPTLELAALSIRGGGVSWDDARAGSLPSYLLPRALLPPLWLPIASTEYLGYVGVAPLVLGFLALVVVRSRFVWFGLSLCFMGLFLAPGENNGNYYLLYANLPGFDSFRVPARWLFVWGFGAAVLAALGADWIARGARVWLRRPDLWPRAALVALVLAAGLAWQRDSGEPLPQRRIVAFWLALAGVTLSTGFLALVGRRWLASAVLVVVAAAELWAVAGFSPARQAPPAGPLAATAAPAAWLKEQADPSRRLLSVARSSYIPRDEGALRTTMSGLPEHVQQSLLVARKWQETLIPNLPLPLGIRSVDGYDGGVLPLRAFVRLASVAIPPDQVRADGALYSRLDGALPPRVLDLFGAQYVLANRDQPGPNDATSLALGELRLDVRRADVPLSLLVFAARIVDDDQALGAMRQDSFDVSGEVLLADSPTTRWPVLSGGRAAQTVEPSAASPESWRARISVPAPAYLLQREAWYPAWRARVDGREAPVARADVLFRAVYLEPGEHDVEIFFDSAALTRGALLSLLGFALAGVLLAWPVRRVIVPVSGRRATG